MKKTSLSTSFVHFACGSGNVNSNSSKKSLKIRLASIFDDSKKRKGIVVLIVVILVVTIVGSIFVIGGNNVEQTNNSLTIYALGMDEKDYGFPRDNYYYNSVVGKFQNKYDNVKVIVKEFPDLTDDEFYQKITSEILSGTGPDVIVANEKFMQNKDLNKIMSSGALASMDGFIKNDTDFDKESFYKGIMTNGLYRGDRYIMPIKFAFPIAVSGENALEKAGLDKDVCQKDYASLMNEIKSYSYDEDSQVFATGSKAIMSDFLVNICSNVTKESPNINTDEFKTFMECYHKLYNNENKDQDYYERDNQLKFHQNKLLFVGSASEPTYVLSELGVQNINASDKAVFIPLKNSDGGISANVSFSAMINANSQNQQNAYNFIKILMQDDSVNSIYNGLPVRKKSLENLIMGMGENDFSISIPNSTEMIFLKPVP